MNRFPNRRTEKERPIPDGDGMDNTDASPETGENDASSGRDYINVASRPCLMKILRKQGDKTIFFADRVLKFTGSGKIKRRILLITEYAVYILDPETYALKRRISQASVEKLCLSELGDNFLAIIIPTEYDLLLASTRKNEIVTAALEATNSEADYEVSVCHSNRFEYHAAANLVKEVRFEEVEGGVRTKIVRK